MRLRVDEHPDVQRIVDRGLAEEIAAYIRRRRAKYPHEIQRWVTVKNICVRFKISQSDFLKIVEAAPDMLNVSDMAFRPAARGANWGEILVASFYPTIWEDAPLGRKIVDDVARALGNPVEAVQIARRLSSLDCQPTASDADLIEAARAAGEG